MKSIQMIRLAIVALIISNLGVGAAVADGQIGDSPATAPYIDNQPHTIQANSGMWFRFDYDATDQPAITIQLVNGTNSGMRLDVWTLDAIADMANNDPIGHGQAFTVACAADAAIQSGCLTKNLIWAGNFVSSGTFYVHIINDNNAPINAAVTIEGPGVSLGFLAMPSGANVPLENSDDPGRAAPIDNAPHTLAANAAVWYRFDYGPSDSTPRPVRVVRLVNGNQTRVQFEVWTPDRINNWWENKPVGRGTAYMMDCETGEESEVGECESNDLKWAGAFHIYGAYHVRVVNENARLATFLLTIN